MAVGARGCPCEGLALAGGVVQTTAIDLANGEVERVAADTFATHIERSKIGVALGVGRACAVSVVARGSPCIGVDGCLGVGRAGVVADAKVQRVGKATRLAVEGGSIGVGIVATGCVGMVAPVVGLADILGIASASRALIEGVFEIGGAIVFVDFDTITPCSAIGSATEVGDVSLAVVVPLGNVPCVTVGATANGVEIGAAAVTVAVINSERRCQQATVGVDRLHSINIAYCGSIVGVAVPSGGAAADIDGLVGSCAVINSEIESNNTVTACNVGQSFGGGVVAGGVSDAVNPCVTIAGRVLVGCRIAAVYSQM